MVHPNFKKANIFFALFFVTLGCCLIIFQHRLVEFIVVVLAALNAFLGLYFIAAHRLYATDDHTRIEEHRLYLTAIVIVIISVVAMSFPEESVTIVGILIGLYLVIISLLSALNTYIYFRNNVPNKWRPFLNTIASALLAVLSFRLNDERGLIITIAGIYFILLGFNNGYDLYRVARQTSYRDDYQRVQRLPLPVIIYSLSPLKMVRYAERALENNQSDVQILNNSLPAPDDIVQVLVNGGASSFDMFGHISLVYQNTVFNYGNYNPASALLGGVIGEGIIALLDKQQYIAYTLGHGSVMAEFDIPLSQEQQARLEAHIEKIMEDTEPFYVNHESPGNKYPNKMMDTVDGQMYRFYRGKYQTYFLFGANCVKLADDIIGSIGIDDLRGSLIMSPGGYFEFFNHAYQRGEWVSDWRILSSEGKDIE